MNDIMECQCSILKMPFYLSLLYSSASHVYNVVTNGRSIQMCLEDCEFLLSCYLPGDPEKNLSVLYERGPWWNMVHAIIQSLVILLLELSNSVVQPTQS